MIKNRIVTLGQFIVDQQNKFPEAKGALSRIFRNLELAAKIVNEKVRKAGLVDVLGEHGTTNVQGEDVKKLDIIANDIFIEILESGGDCCCVLSEEIEYVHQMESLEGKKAEYYVAMDPLDGSSNIDVNASIGTIFSVFKRTSNGGEPTEKEVLQKGVEQVAAGYFIYGSSTMLVYTTGNGVNGFTLDDSISEFCLSHPNIKTPEDGSIYSVNEGNYEQFPEGVKEYIQYCKNTTDKKPYSARYIGSLIADFHRNLLKGGIYMYPPTGSAPNGKLRLMYECNTMAFIAEQAGGIAIDGNQRIMEVEPTELHQRVPLYVGSKNMVAKLQEYINETVSLG
jgi:fructose-1,6-bisphosphatase I